MAINFPANKISITATGGTFISTSTGLFSGTSQVHVFTSPGIFTATVSFSTVTILVVGGGGGGAGDYAPGVSNYVGGGGGAGGVVLATFSLSVGTYNVTVGTGGGAGGLGTPGPTAPSRGSTGTNSIFSGPSVLLVGLGGGGATYCWGGCGGSGAGGGGIPSGRVNCAGVANQPGQAQTIPPGGSYANYGFPGGCAGNGPSAVGGSGGGARSSGGFGSPTPGNSPGGVGLPTAITGTPQVVSAGGVGGGNNSNPVPPVGYGNGGRGGPGFSHAGTPGQGGVVVVSYPAGAGGYVDGVVFTTSTVLGSETWIYSIAQSRWEVSTGTTSTISISATGISCQPNIGTGAFALPIGTTAQRITPVRSGALRYNSSIGQVEAYYTNTGWTTDLGNTQTVYTVQYLGVGGGGGGGQAGPPFPAPGGNGGTGAVAQGFTSTIAGTSYTITVGSGGVANSVPAGPGINPGGGSGGTTSITGPGGYLLLALGGLGGTGGTGFGGAGVNGSDGTAPVGGSPSIATTAGIYSNITGASVLYGKRYPASPTSTYGTGGAGGPGGNNTLGTPGNSGVVVIKYVGAQRGIGGSVSPIGTYTIHTFTSPGTYVA